MSMSAFEEDMKALKILSCSDSMMWYADKVGITVPLLRIEENEYISREPSGYINIVKKTDAIIIEYYGEENDHSTIEEKSTCSSEQS